MGIKTSFPVYNAETDGNVFNWVMGAVEDFRKIRQKERDVELKKASTKPESVDRTKVEN